jgi:hypothetical protein
MYLTPPTLRLPQRYLKPPILQEQLPRHNVFAEMHTVSCILNCGWFHGNSRQVDMSLVRTLPHTIPEYKSHIPEMKCLTPAG